MFKKIISTLLIITVFAGMAVLVPVSAGAASKPKLNKTKLSIKVGNTYKLKLSNATASKIKWSSSKYAVASVSSKGKVTARSKGTATITAQYKNKKYKCKVTVKPNVKYFGKTFSVFVGGNITLYVQSTFGSKAVDKWKSSDTSKATINKSGKITGKKAGKVTITAYCSDGSEVRGTVQVLDPYKALKNHILNKGYVDNDGYNYVYFSDGNFEGFISYKPENNVFEVLSVYKRSDGDLYLGFELSKNNTSSINMITTFKADDKYSFSANAYLNPKTYTTNTDLEFNYTLEDDSFDGESVNYLSNAMVLYTLGKTESYLYDELEMKLNSFGFKKF